MKPLEPEAWAKEAAQQASDLGVAIRNLRSGQDAIRIAAATAEGRAQIEQLITNCNAIRGPMAATAKEYELAIQAFQRALRKGRWGIRA